MRLTSKLGQWMLVLLCMSLGFSACEHRTLEDIEYSHYVRVYIDDKIPNVTTGFFNEQYAKPEFKYPEIMRVMLCNPNSGEMASERYLLQKGQDERGFYFEGFVGAPSGHYDLLLYNCDTELTQIENATNFRTIEAYTNPVSSSFYSKSSLLMDSIDTSHVLYEPNHLFTADRRGVHISLNSKVDTLLTEKGDYFTAQSLVKTYFLQLHIRGAQWVKAAKAVISGVSASVTLTEGKLSPESSSALLDVRCAIEKAKLLNEISMEDEGQEATIYTTFNMFGRVPGESSTSIRFEFIKTDGTSQIETIDLTSLFTTKEGVENHWLLPDCEIKIEPAKMIEPENETPNGFYPTVEDWNNEIFDIII